MADPHGNGTVIEQAETLIRRLRGVAAARVDANERGGVGVVHVLGRSDRSPKVIALDVTSALAAELGVTLDPRQVRVSMLRREDTEEAPGLSRLKFVGLSTATIRNTAEARVHLEDHGMIYEGAASGPNTPSHRLDLVAEAALRGVEVFLRAEGLFVLEGAGVAQCAGRDVAVVVISIAGPEEEHLSGSSVVRDDPREAVVRAVLAAVNRPVGWLAGR